MQNSSLGSTQPVIDVDSAVARRGQIVFQRLRKRLVVSFVGVSLVIYLLTTALALAVFWTWVNISIQGNLNRLITECEPAIKLQDGHLTLKDWATNARREQLNIPEVVQLYDRSARLTEQYGVDGVSQLVNGDVSLRELHALNHFCSKYVPVMQSGYLQIQIARHQADDAIAQFFWTMILLIPCVALVAGVFGYFYSDRVVRPLAKSLDVLRRFVDDAGHELRTPITVIAASVETLDRILEEHNVQTEVAKRIARASQRLGSLSSSLVLLARMESPELRLQMSAVDIDQIVAQVVDELGAEAQEHGVEILFNAGCGITLSGHYDSLYRMVANVADNAIRYTNSGGKVRIATARQNKQVLITVEDNGIGIPKESLDRIFDRFYRVDEARSTEQGGTGLGLSIVKAIAEAHFGSVKVISEINCGSKFIINLPRVVALIKD